MKTYIKNFGYPICMTCLTMAKDSIEASEKFNAYVENSGHKLDGVQMFLYEVNGSSIHFV